MVNPDGVIIGNTRTSTAGKDLNRQFLLANKDIYPEVSLVKEFAKNLNYKLNNKKFNNIKFIIKTIFL